MSRTYGKAVYEPPEGRQRNGVWRLNLEPHVAMKLKHVFRRVAGNQHGTLTMQDSAEVCRDLQWFTTRYPLELDEDSLRHLRGQSDVHRKLMVSVEAVLSGEYKPRAFDLALPPYDFQQVAADLTLRFGGLLLGDDVGLGKTVSAIAVLSDPRARPALFVTLTHLPQQIEREIKRFAPGLTTHIAKQGTPYDITAPAGTKKIRERRFDPSTGRMPDVLITSYSKLQGWADELGPHINGLIFDEVQQLRHTGTDKYSAAKHIASFASVRLGLSATPIHNYGSEFYAVIDILRPGEVGTWNEFQTEWTGVTDARGRALIKDQRAFGTYLRESGIMLRRTRTEVGRELPPVLEIPHFVETDSKPLEDVKSSAAALARLILASTGGGFEKGRASEEFDMRLRQATGIAKAVAVAAFVRLLVESGEPVLLYGWHHAVYEIWKEQLADLGVVMFTGMESAAQKRASIARFESGEAKVLIMSLRSGAGIDGLQFVCRTVVFGELDWAYAVHLQGGGRVARDGQKNPVSIYTLLSEDGSDPFIAEVLGVKAGQLNGVIDPSADLVVYRQTDPQRIKKMAAAYLNVSLPEASP